MFRNVITTERELRDLMGDASEGSIKKETTYLTAECVRFIECSPFMLLATSSANGRCDVAPKGDPAGFVRVLDEKHLVIPDRPGNKRFDGLRNIFENPQIGLIFLVPGRHETVRVNGKAYITQDPEILDSMPVQGKRPWFGIGVEVEECFMHCGKAFLRSELWEPASWPDLATVPSGAEILKGTKRGFDQTVEEIETYLKESYRTRMY
jgi:PPOX class probable FMN-dependent enzyme